MKTRTKPSMPDIKTSYYPPGIIGPKPEKIGALGILLIVGAVALGIALLVTVFT